MMAWQSKRFVLDEVKKKYNAKIKLLGDQPYLDGPSLFRREKQVR